MQVLALDFDGVVCDSAQEVFLVGLRTFKDLAPDSALIRRFLDAEPDGRELDELFTAFSDLLPLGNRAEDFGVALGAIDAAVAITSQDDYDRFYSTLESSWLQAFHRRFYEQRAALRDHDRDAWIRLHSTYREFTDQLEAISERVRLAIVTAKDRASARLLLAHFGLDTLFADELVLDKETGVRKSGHLGVLQARLDIPFEAVTFVDDKVNHLLEVTHLGVGRVLAGWGYNTNREYEIARTHGIPVATFENVERVLFGDTGR
jgi:phosphoglycolate phosphatase-like HAD superfamily hydrolase